MELRDFVEDTLLQIIDGVRSVQSKNAECLSYAEKQRCTVHFDVSLGTDNLTNAGGKAGAMFGNLFVRGHATTEDKQTAQNNIKFDIPIILPVFEENCKDIVPL